MTFWRPESLTSLETTLLEKCLDAHAQSVGRENVSTTVFYAAAIGSREYTKALAAALCSLGGPHAPLVETYELLQHPERAAQLLDAGLKVPGWGNSFAKGAIDPIWQPLAVLLQENFPGIYQAVDQVTITLHRRGKEIFPNPSCFTAAVGLVLRMPKEVVPWIFVQGRLGKWSEIFSNILIT
jgi:hypothetical protein